MTAVIAAKMYRTIPFRRLALAPAIAAFKAGWTMFLSSSAVSLYTMANTFILGLFTTAAGVAYYGGAERIVIAVIGLMSPITQALYPRMSHLAANDREKATDAIQKALIFFGIMGLIAGGALIALAPWIIRLVLGPAYGPAIPVMRIASVVIPVLRGEQYPGRSMDAAVRNGPRLQPHCRFRGTDECRSGRRSLAAFWAGGHRVIRRGVSDIRLDVHVIALLRSRRNERLRPPAGVQLAQPTHL